MREINSEGLNKFSEHFLAGQNICKQMPKELAELEHNLKRLNNYAAEYNRMKENSEKDERIELPSVETCYSVKEDILEGRTPIEKIVIPPPEPIAIISQSEKTDFHVQKDSKAGMYFMQDVIPSSTFINAIQRELITLNDLSPSIGYIVREMKKEFDHFKVCGGCLKQVSSLLPDILKELQELIKFVKKKRHESYFSPDDSNYLKKSSRKLKETLKNDFSLKKIKQRVNCSTIQGEKQDKLREINSFVLGDQISNDKLGYSLRRYSMRLANCQQLSIFRPETQNELSLFEKLETIDNDNTLITSGNDRNKLFLNELSTAQIMRILHPVPTVEKAIQLQMTGIVSCFTTDSICEKISLDRGESENHATLQTKDFLTSARVALEETCASFQLKSDLEMDEELKTDLKDLKHLMFEAHKNQIELNEVLLKKGLLTAVLSQLTDPKMLYEEKIGLEKAKHTLSDEGRALQNPAEKQLQRLVEHLKHRCNVKNRMIIALLNGLRSNVPKQQWHELILHVLQEEGTENLENFFLQSTSSNPDHDQLIGSRGEWQTKKEFDIEEISVEKEVNEKNGRDKKLGEEKAKISFSEVISKTSKCLQMAEADFKLRGRTSLPPPKSSLLTVCGINEMNPRTAEFLRNLDSEIKSMVNHRNQCGGEDTKAANLSNDINTTDREILESETELATINLTIKIGNEETLSQYMSAMSVIPTRTTLREIKSEISLPCFLESTPKIDFTGGDSGTKRQRETSASRSFTSVILKLKVPLTFREDGDQENLKESPAPKEIFISNESKTDSPIPLNSDRKKDTHAKEMRVVKLSDEPLSEKFKIDFQKNTSVVHPPINIYLEHITTTQNLQSRLRVLQENLGNLTKTMDRMSLLTDKLAEDAEESAQNFKHLFHLYAAISDGLNM